MNNDIIYDQFSENYDRFVNWEGRLELELPFLKTELSPQKRSDHNQISVLDVACGTGQHSIALQKQGFSCSGADISKKMVEIAQKNAQTMGLIIPFKHAGFGHLTSAFENQKFDSLICLGNSLPHVLNEEEMVSTLKDFKNVLKPGGKIIIQNRNFDKIIKTKNRWMEPEAHIEDEQNWLFVRFYDFDPDGMITFNIIILHKEKGSVFQQNIISTRLWPFSYFKLVDWLNNAQFDNINLFSSLQGEVFDVDRSPNLVVTAIAN